jgi:hypothetical protein
MHVIMQFCGLNHDRSTCEYLMLITNDMEDRCSSLSAILCVTIGFESMRSIRRDTCIVHRGETCSQSTVEKG